MNYKKLIRGLASEIEKQFIANEEKYPTPEWRELSNKELLFEFYYHVGKLQGAIWMDDKEKMKEHCGDIGAIAVMFMDNNKLL